MYRIDSGTITKKPFKSKQGHLRAEAYATRAGVFPYMNADGSIRYELRHPDDVFNKKSLATLGGVPVTVGHPKERVTPANFSQLGKGTVGDSIEAVNPYVKVVLNVQAQDAIEALEKRTHKDVSLVYATDVAEDSGVWEGIPYTHRQIGILHEDGERYIDYRELALVERGRAGSICGVHLDGLDEDLAVQVREDAKEEKANMATLHLDNMSFEVDAGVAQAVTSKITKLDAALADVQTQFKQKSAQFDSLLSALQKAGFENADDVATALKALKAEVEKSKGEAIAAQEETKQAKGEADQAKEQLGAMKETVAKKDAADIASKFLPTDVKLDSLDSLGIKKTLIQHKYPDIKLDDLSVETLEGMWTVATRADSTTPLRNAAQTATETKLDAKDPAISARDAMSQRRMKKKGVA